MANREVESENNTDKKIRAELSSSIAYYRKALKMTRGELATAVGVTEASIGQYERGNRVPSIEILCRLSDVFNVPVDSLLGHGENYDVVKQYRLDKAEEFFIHAGWTGFIVNSLDNGHIQIQQKVEDFSKYEIVDGRIVRETFDDKLDTNTLIEFKDADAFIHFAELLMNTFLRAKYGYEHLLKVIKDLQKTGSFRVPSLELKDRKIETN